MDGTMSAVPERKPLLGPDGQWDRVALAAWFQDDACWKAVMPDDDLYFCGPCSGDLLITDDAIEPVAGALVLLVEELVSTYVAHAELDADGRLCVDIEGRLVPILEDDAPYGLVLVVVGYVAMTGGKEPTLQDLQRAQVVLGLDETKPGPRAARISPDELPF